MVVVREVLSDTQKHRRPVAPAAAMECPSSILSSHLRSFAVVLWSSLASFMTASRVSALTPREEGEEEVERNLPPVPFAASFFCSLSIACCLMTVAVVARGGGALRVAVSLSATTATPSSSPSPPPSNSKTSTISPDDAGRSIAMTSIPWLPSSLTSLVSLGVPHSSQTLSSGLFSRVQVAHSQSTPANIFFFLPSFLSLGLC